MNSTTTLLAATLLAASSAFGGINVNFNITDATKTRVVTTFDYSESGSDAGNTPGGDGDWMFIGHDTVGNPPTGTDFELSNPAVPVGSNITAGRVITGSPLAGATATHLQLEFSLSANTAQSSTKDWQIKVDSMFGGSRVSPKEDFQITSALAGTRIVWTLALTQTLTGVAADGNGAYALDNYGSAGVIAAVLQNDTGSAAQLGVTFHEVRFVTGEIIVPEPATYGLIFGGFIFTYILIRRRKTRR